jgi:hypothetical protein
MLYREKGEREELDSELNFPIEAVRVCCMAKQLLLSIESLLAV